MFENVCKTRRNMYKLTYTDIASKWSSIDSQDVSLFHALSKSPQGPVARPFRTSFDVLQRKPLGYKNRDKQEVCHFFNRLINILPDVKELSRKLVEKYSHTSYLQRDILGISVIPSSIRHFILSEVQKVSSEQAKTCKQVTFISLK